MGGIKMAAGYWTVMWGGNGALSRNRQTSLIDNMRVNAYSAVDSVT